MKVFRIAAASVARTRKEAFSGRGGLLAPGRWHTTGRLVVYTAESLSLAALEILAHLKQTHHIRPFNAFAAEIPDDLILKPSSYPAHWQTRLPASRAFGNHWLDAGTTPALLVPTVLTTGEWNVLLNPAHPKFSLDWITDGPRAYAFDARLLHLRR
ncbi:MAG TPA: RES family NAD+ phosphorylase [Opitutaceae bacterium]|nr:RES family NAD+ phosphorylase [Opitutaceae bacterium]